MNESKARVNSKSWKTVDKASRLRSSEGATATERQQAELEAGEMKNDVLLL